MGSSGMLRLVSALGLGTVLFAVSVGASTEEAARKVLASRCWACHAQTAMADLRLDSREAMLRGGKSGPAIVEGDATSSRLFQAIARQTPGLMAMPPGPPLPEEELTAIRRWIEEGAPWKDETTHWAYRPLRKVTPSESIDHWLARAHRSKGITANPMADRRTLIRRASFDLTGLPPEPETFDAAMQDSNPQWFARFVDGLIASPHFGEKWARHWLDVARYGEDDFTGTEVVPYPNAWRYRDWVVQAINDDMPYNRFLMAQLAGDLMGDPALLPATGLLGLGPWYYGIAQPAQSRADERNDRVDMVTRGMLGVTVACARCHDHKYDPFSIHDYYALAGVFASTAYREYPLVSEAEAATWQQRKKDADAAEKALKDFLDNQGRTIARDFAPRIADFMLAANGKSRTHDLPPQLVERWKAYLSQPEDKHPFLIGWFSGKQKVREAARFQQLLLDIVAEKDAIENENKTLVEAAKATAAKVQRTIVLPGGYRSEEDFNPGADIPAKSLDRDRFVAWQRIFGDKSAPLKLGHDLIIALLNPSERQHYEELREQAETLRAALPVKYPFLHGAAEFEPWDLQLHLRGNPEDLGEVVPRAFPAILNSGQPLPLREGSGRLELARTVAHHPLAARVAVNRAWMVLLGSGIVATPSNFGAVGTRPTVPELLELLAGRFAESGYSTKALIREIALSKAYQRSAASSSANILADAGNTTFWRQSRRRLDAEPLLDTMLAATGELSRELGGESQALDASFTRRMLYAKSGRFQPDETLALFDLPSALVTCEQRVVTTVPLQKLFLLNSAMVGERAKVLADRIKHANPTQGVESAYHLLFQRSASEDELADAIEFLGDGRDEGWIDLAWVLLSTNEFAYVD